MTLSANDLSGRLREAPLLPGARNWMEGRKPQLPEVQLPFLAPAGAVYQTRSVHSCR